MVQNCLELALDAFLFLNACHQDYPRPAGSAILPKLPMITHTIKKERKTSSCMVFEGPAADRLSLHRLRTATVVVSCQIAVMNSSAFQEHDMYISVVWHDISLERK